MKDYVVSFFREHVDSFGQRCLSKLDTFNVTASSSMDEAANSAKRMFERTHDLAHWGDLANDVEIRPLRHGDAEKMQRQA